MVDGVRCEILQSKLDAVRGVGLTSIKFKCEKRLALFAPGDVVAFDLMEVERDEEFGDSSCWNACEGVIMRMEPTRALICVLQDRCEIETVRPIMRLKHGGLRKTGEKYSVCIHCGRPEGVEIKLPDFGQSGPDARLHDWECTERDHGHTLPCVFGSDGESTT